MQQHRVSGYWVLFQVCLVVWIILATNVEVPGRLELLVHQGRMGTIATTGFLWAVGLLGMAAILLQPRWPLRLFWALIAGLGGSIAWGFHQAVNLELSVFDILGFWDARHETGRAGAIYGDAIWKGCLLAAVSTIIFAAPFVARRLSFRRGVALLGIFPAIPVALIAAVVFAKGGNGHYALPKQFSQASLGILVTGKLVLKGQLEHQPATITADAAAGQEHILMLVDESLRADYVSAVPGNDVTPNFAKVGSRMVNYGPAYSGGICSNYSNALLRFMAARSDLGGAVASNPTVWQYAKAAGYRTVFIDAQAHAMKSEHELQNFMTSEELKWVDDVYPLRAETPATADMKLIEIVEAELKKPGKVFIYANKQGMHFPYDTTYNPKAAVFHPTVSENPIVSRQSNINSYRNSILWNVEHFFGAFDSRIDMGNLSMVYTSDHGQLFEPHDATHCKSSDTSPQMALVPLFAYSSDQNSQGRLQIGAGKSHLSANHFQIAPTLLEWMGYRAGDIPAKYSESLTAGSTAAPAYSVGDIFGLFSSDVHWEPIDLSRNYLEYPLSLQNQASNANGTEGQIQ